MGSIAAHVDWQKFAPRGNSKAALQEGFFDHVLRSHESYSQKWEYVRTNPVRAHLSKTPEEWPYQGEIVRIAFD